jgi:hypothetical protein
MIKTSLEKLAKEVGFDIGCSDDIVQSDLLNGFFEGLNNSMPIKADIELQMCYISKKLNMRENNIEFRCFRIGKFRFIYVLEETRAIFLDVMYRELGYKHNYMDKLLEVYKHGN